MSVKNNDRERAFVYLREMTDEKGKKARIAIAGAFGEMLNRAFDQLEEAGDALAAWQVSHDWRDASLDDAIVTIPDAPIDQFVEWIPGAGSSSQTEGGNVVQEPTTEEG